MDPGQLVATQPIEEDALWHWHSGPAAKARGLELLLGEGLEVLDLSLGANVEWHTLVHLQPYPLLGAQLNGSRQQRLCSSNIRVHALL